MERYWLTVPGAQQLVQFVVFESWWVHQLGVPDSRSQTVVFRGGQPRRRHRTHHAHTLVRAIAVVDNVVVLVIRESRRQNGQRRGAHAVDLLGGKRRYLGP